MNVKFKYTVRRLHPQKTLRMLRYRLDGKAGKARLDTRNLKGVALPKTNARQGTKASDQTDESCNWTIWVRADYYSA